MPKSRLRKNRKTRIQYILSAPAKVFKEIYLTVKGQRLMASTHLTKETKQAIFDLYGKNRYTRNDVSIVKVIKH